MKKLVSYIFLILLFFQAAFVDAATLGVGASKVNVSANDTFSASISVNTQGKAVNNIEAVLTFPSNLLEVTGVTAGSVLSMWVENPTFSNAAGTVSFNGGVPNPGFTGTGTVITIGFRAKQSGTAPLAFSTAFVRENDGLGTNILSSRSGTSITINATTPVAPPTETPAEPVANRVRITSSSHPDSNSWYKNNVANFAWTIPSGATSSQTGLDNLVNGAPRVVRTPAASSINVPTVPDGVSYFHARFMVNGAWGPVSTFRIQVDTVAPSNVTAELASNNEGRPVLNVSAFDDLSGVDYFTITGSDGKEQRIAADQSRGQLVLDPSITGAQNFSITAFDKAGNSFNTTKVIEVPQLQQIIINSVTEKIKAGEPVTIKGLVPIANTEYVVNFESESGLSWSYKQISGPVGEFEFTSEPLAKAGTYKIWVESTNKDGVKISTPPQSVLVAQGKFDQLKNVVANALKQITFERLTIGLLAIAAFIGWYKFYQLKRAIAFNGKIPTAVRTSRSRKVKEKNESE